MMDVVLKVRTRTGEHAFREDVCMCTLKYRRWNNELRSFQSLKRRVANIFWKQNLLSDDSNGTSTQIILNNVESEDEGSVPTNSKRNSIHSNWSDLLSVDKDAEYRNTRRSEPNIVGVATTSAASTVEATKGSSISPGKMTVKNIVLLSYMPKLMDWGSWCIRFPYVTSTIASFLWCNQMNKEKKKREKWSMSHIVHTIPCPSS